MNRRTVAFVGTLLVGVLAVGQHGRTEVLLR